MMQATKSNVLKGAVLAGLMAAAGQAGAVPTTTIFQEDFEDGSANGFTLSGLWHVTQDFPAAGLYTLGYVQGEGPNIPDSTPDGNFNTGSRTFGSAISPLISIPISGITILSFAAWNDGECVTGTLNCGGSNGWDRLTVQLTNGSLTTTIASTSPSLYPAGTSGIPDGGSNYTNVSANLTALGYGGTSVRASFIFDSRDSISNNFPGARVDNISVKTTASVPEPGSLALLGLGLAGLGWMRKKSPANA